MIFQQPSVWFLLLLLALPLLWWRSRRARSAMPFSSTAGVESVPPSWAVYARWIVPVLRYAALILLIIAVARPQKANERTPIFTEGIAIQLVIDRSGSMLAMDFEKNGEPVDRLTAVKDVVDEFIQGGDDLPGRPNDLVGLIVFGTFADSVCPLTLDHTHLVQTVESVEVPDEDDERGTAIGDAIALGVERIRGLEKRRDIKQDMGIKSRVMILLTDGQNTSGDIDPMTAAEMAKAFDIKIYTIGAGTDRAFAPMPSRDPFTGRTVYRPMPVSIDEATLKQIAQLTGGEYFRATDSNSLKDIYEVIDRLERTEIEQRRYMDYRELAVQSIDLNGLNFPPVLLMVLVLLGVETALASTRFRTTT